MSWITAPFGDIVDLRQGMAFNKKNRHLVGEEGIPILRIVDLNDKTETKFIQEDLVPPQFIATPSDIIYSRTGIHLGLVYTNRKGIVHNNCFRVIPKIEGIHRGYLFWFLKQPKIIEEARSKAGGAAQPDLNHGAFKSINFQYPKLQTQKRIADILSAYDDLIENNLRRIQLLEQAAQNIYKEWFVHLRFPGHEKTRINEETGLPEGWEKKMLKDLCHLTMGQSPKSEYYNLDNEGLPFHQGVTGYGNRFVTHSTYCTKITRIAEEGDILCSVRAPVGRLNISPSKLIIGRGLSAVRNKNGFQSFQFCQLKNHFYQEDMIGGGAIFNSVTKKVLEEQKLLSPNIEVQEEFEKIVIPIDNQIVNLDKQNQKLKAARDILLPRLMNRTIEV